jgi:5'-nucleotidase/UDP-sugar diphosphatase
MRAWILSVSAASALGSGCVAYNSCEAPVANPDETVAVLKSGEIIYLEKTWTRHANNAIGQAAAAAFRDAFSSTNDKADVGVVNGGDLRSEGLCAPRTQIKGSVLRGMVHEVLLFDNVVYAVNVTEEELVKALEHSVAPLVPLGPKGENREITGAPARFLQVEGVTFTVDCGKPANSRVSDVKVNGRALASPASPTQMVRVAMPKFIMDGGDSYTMFEGPGLDASRKPEQAKRLGGTEGRLTSDYMFRTYKNDSNPGGPELSVEERVKFVGCSSPTPPR